MFGSCEIFSFCLLKYPYSCFSSHFFFLVFVIVYKKRFSFSFQEFWSHVLGFSCAILSFCLLKYPYSCFSSHFCFLVIVVLFVFVLSLLLLATLISLSLPFQCSLQVLIWMHPCYLQSWRILFHLLFWTHIVYNISSIVISFLVFWSICLGSSFVHINNGPEYLRRGKQPRCLSLCSWRRLLQRGLEFHVCTINKSAHTKKVWKLI